MQSNLFYSYKYHNFYTFVFIVIFILMDRQRKRHTWTLLNRKLLIKVALKYRSLHKLTSSDMIKAIIKDPEFKSKFMFLFNLVFLI